MSFDDGSVEYWERAAEDGDLPAMRRVSRLLQESDPQRSLHWLKRAAEGGDSNAMHTVAYRLAESDPAEALPWYRRAAENGEVGAMYNLGELLRGADRREAQRWFEQAALSGHPRAMNNLAALIRWRHPRESLRWRRLAAAKGNTYAMLALSRMADAKGIFSFGSRRRQLMAESVDWLQKSAGSENTAAMWELALHYMSLRKEDEARYWFQSAADRGHVEARAALDGGLTGRRAGWRIVTDQVRLMLRRG